MIWFESLAPWLRILLAGYWRISLMLAVAALWQARRDGWWSGSAPKHAMVAMLTLALGVFCIGLPLFLWMLLTDELPAWLRRRSRDEIGREDLAFQIGRRHLGDVVDVAVLEASQRVCDPMGAVPDLPFGHLYARWLSLRLQLTPGRQLYRFSMLRRGLHGRRRMIHHGLAVVDEHKAVVSWWVTDREVC